MDINIPQLELLLSKRQITNAGVDMEKGEILHTRLVQLL